jgi:transposase-like protein
MVLVLLCGIGPNDTRFIYGFGMFITENATDMTWMLKLFRKWGLDLDVTGTVITSDRGAAIGKTYEDCFNNAVHICCGVHLKRNLKEHGNNEYKHAVF